MVYVKLKLTINISGVQGLLFLTESQQTQDIRYSHLKEKFLILFKKSISSLSAFTDYGIKYQLGTFSPTILSMISGVPQATAIETQQELGDRERTG